MKLSAIYLAEEDLFRGKRLEIHISIFYMSHNNFSSLIVLKKTNKASNHPNASAILGAGALARVLSMCDVLFQIECRSL